MGRTTRLKCVLRERSKAITRSKRSNRRLSAGEKWLFVTPLIFFGAAAFFLSVRKATSPRFIGTELPVDHVIWLGNDKIFVVERNMNSRAKVHSISAIYNVATGEKLLEREWDSDIISSQISPDGRLWLSQEGPDRYGRNYVIRDLKYFSTITTIPKSINTRSSFFWRHDNRLQSTSYKLKSKSGDKPSHSLWQLDEKSGQLSYIRALNEDPQIIFKSPNKKWAIKELIGARVSRTKIETSYNKAKLSFTPSTYSIVSLPEQRTISKLPHDSQSNMVWSKDSNILSSTVRLRDSQGRTDILRYDLQKRALTSVKLKNTDDVLAPYKLNDMPSQFSPDGRLWCAGSLSGTKWAFWNTETGELVKTIGSIPKVQDNYRPSIFPSFSKDSRLFFRPTKTGIEIYDTSRFLS